MKPARLIILPLLLALTACGRPATREEGPSTRQLQQTVFSAIFDREESILAYADDCLRLTDSLRWRCLHCPDRELRISAKESVFTFYNYALSGKYLTEPEMGFFIDSLAEPLDSVVQSWYCEGEPGRRLMSNYIISLDDTYKLRTTELRVFPSDSLGDCLAIVFPDNAIGDPFIILRDSAMLPPVDFWGEEDIPVCIPPSDDTNMTVLIGHEAVEEMMHSKAIVVFYSIAESDEPQSCMLLLGAFHRQYPSLNSCS